MLAIPGQTQESLGESIRFLTALPVTHLSAYLLKIEAGTPFAERPPGLPGEDDTASLYLACCEALEEAGFPQYEISNFAKPGHSARHNLGYWRCEPYLGLGPSAHSFLGGRRRFFDRDLPAFLAADDPFSLWRDDGPGGDTEERLMLGLRLTGGIDAAALCEDPAPLLKQARALAGHGLCRVEGTVVSLTRQGFLLSNPVILSLLGALSGAESSMGRQGL